jgi:two-component system, NtrC family, response regulator HydG
MLILFYFFINFDTLGSIMEKLLIVEDDIAYAQILESFLTRHGFAISHSSNLKNAEKLVQQKKFDLFLLDYRLPDGTGLDLLQTVKGKTPEIPVVLMTGFNDVRLVVRAMKMGATDYILKPVNPDELLMLVRHSLKQTRKDQSSPRHERYSPTFVKGISTAALKVQEFIELVAPTDMSVIIQGESGTGKEFVARAIHAASNRATRTFMPIDCGVLSKDLAAGELFGYVKGAFTGATMDKKGQLETASGGTLFLDEISNLSYEVQIKLLRALQEKVIQPVGSDRIIGVDIRLIVATNENLLTSVEEGNFREDLYHRLNEFKITVPPLKDRENDLFLFTDHFIREANHDLGRNVERLSPEVSDIFSSYDWPGNLRELRNTIRRMVLLCRGTEAQKELLPEDMFHFVNKENTQDHGSNLKTIQISTEKAQISRILMETGGNKSKAARLLHITRKTLYDKMKKYGIN